MMKSEYWKVYKWVEWFMIHHSFRRPEDINPFVLHDHARYMVAGGKAEFNLPSYGAKFIVKLK